MAFTATEQREMLAETGVVATVPVAGDATAALMVVANLAEQVQLTGGEVYQTPRYAIAAQADVTDLALTGDQDSGTLITIAGAVYRITAIEPRRDGFATLWLGDYVAPEEP